MQILMNIFDEIEKLCVEGTNLKKFDFPVHMLDIRGKIILQALSYDPKVVPHIPLFNKMEDERLKEILQIAAAATESPEAATPYVINAYCRSIGEDVSRDLLAFATDFSASRTLKFRIAFSSFALSFSSMHQDSEKKRVQARLQAMEEEGFVIGKSKRKEHVLMDCDENRRLLRNYCREKFGTEPWEILSHDGYLRDITVVMQYDRYLPVFREKEQATASNQLTADDVIRLKKAIADARNAMATYYELSKIGDGNIVLACLYGELYEIESITNVRADIWEEQEKEVADTRAKNQRIRSIEDEIQRDVMPRVVPHLRDWIGQVTNNTENFAKKMGLWLDQLILLEHNCIDLIFSNNNLQCEEPEIRLDGKMADRGCEFYVFNTPENVKTILDTVQSILPSAELESYEVKQYQDFQYIRKLHIRTGDPSDMMRILQMKIADE